MQHAKLSKQNQDMLGRQDLIDPELQQLIEEIRERHQREIKNLKELQQEQLGFNEEANVRLKTENIKKIKHKDEQIEKLQQIIERLGIELAKMSEQLSFIEERAEEKVVKASNIEEDWTFNLVLMLIAGSVAAIVVFATSVYCACLVCNRSRTRKSKNDHIGSYQEKPSESSKGTNFEFCVVTLNTPK